MTTHGSRRKLLLVEAILIVASILLAFSIDAWWDRRQEDRQRTELLEALRAEFLQTSTGLDTAIQGAEDMLARTGEYLDIVRRAEDVPRDSLVSLFRGVGDIVFFQPTLASYRTATTSGSIDLVRSSGLVTALTEFDLALGLYELHLDVSADLYYLGPVQDFRRAGGMMDSPGGRQGAVGVPIVPSDLDMRGPLAVSTVEPIYTIQRNMMENFRAMRTAAEQIVSELDALLGEA